MTTSRLHLTNVGPTRRPDSLGQNPASLSGFVAKRLMFAGDGGSVSRPPFPSVCADGGSISTPLEPRDASRRMRHFASSRNRPSSVAVIAFRRRFAPGILQHRVGDLSLLPFTATPHRRVLFTPRREPPSSAPLLPTYLPTFSLAHLLSLAIPFLRC